MSHFLNNTFESAFAVHGFLERNARGSGHFRLEPRSDHRCRFFDALDCRITGALILEAIRSLGRSSINAECNSTGSGSENYAHRVRFRKAIEKLSEFKSRSILALEFPIKIQGGSFRSRDIPFDPACPSKGALKHLGSPRRRPGSKASSIPPRLSCAWTFFMPTNFGRSDFKSDSRSAITRSERLRDSSSRMRSQAQFASRIVCKPGQKKFRIPDVQEKRVRHEGQGGHGRPASVDTDSRLKRVHLLSSPYHPSFLECAQENSAQISPPVFLHTRNQ